MSGNISLEEAMLGINVTVGIYLASPAVYMQVSNVTGQPMSGFMYDLESYIASTYGINFKFIAIPSPASKESWTSRLVKVLPYVDIFANNAFSDTVDRRSKGIGFTQGITDASLVLVAIQKEKVTVNFWSFLLPFTNDLWGYIGMSICI